jgi:hypothetical protein
MKNNGNAVDKSFCAVITGMITYTMNMKLQQYIHYRREDPAAPTNFSTSLTSKNFSTSLTSQICRPPGPAKNVPPP